MAFSDLVNALDALVATTFASTADNSGTPMQLTAHLPSGDLLVPVVVKNPAMEEDFVPGSNTGTDVLLLFVPSSFIVLIPRGVTATYGGNDYDIFQTMVDREGGQTLKLRKRTQRWDQ